MTDEKRTPERVFIQVGTTFDAAEAQRIRASIRKAEPAPVALEFGDVSQYEDAAISDLARELADVRRPIAVRGLPLRHYRMLRGTAAPG